MKCMLPIPFTRAFGNKLPRQSTKAIDNNAIRYNSKSYKPFLEV